MIRLVGFLLIAASLFSATSKVMAEDRFITVASTTSTKNSGLYDHILPLFEANSGVQVRVVAVGTGKAIRLAKNGDADVLLVHHRPSEELFVAEGYGVERFDVMYNDFVIVGPGSDPAGIRGLTDANKALTKIVSKQAIFVSRGDDSGTNKKELELWGSAGVDAKAASGSWYRETGAGMGATLNTASAMNAYTLTDRGTWLKFKNKGSLKVVVEGDERLFNPYGVILVNPIQHPHVKKNDAEAFINWITGPDGQAAIASHTINGNQLFFPNANR